MTNLIALPLPPAPDTPDPVPDSEKTFTWAEVQVMTTAATNAAVAATLAACGLKSVPDSPRRHLSVVPG